MKTYYLLRNRLKLLFLPAIILSLGACSSYQYSGYETDGIYGESRPGIWEQADNEQTQVKPNNQNNYYKNMFAQQSEMVGELLESDVFTDVDSYSSNDGYDNYSEVGGDVAYVGGNAPWGNDPDTYTINIINNGPGFGFGRPLGWGYGFGHPYFGSFYDPFYDPFFDPFFNPYARRGLAFGFGNRWGYGGFGGPWGYGGFGYGWSYGYNFGFGNPWFNNGFYNRYGYGYPYIGRNRNNVAYNRGRRNTNEYRSSNDDRRSGYSESIRSIRNAQADAARSRSRARGTSDGYDRNNVYSRTSRRTERSGYYDTSNTRTSSPVYRSTRSSSSRSTQTTSPSRRSSSNSSSVRSSSSSSRSSGSTSRGSSGGSSRTSRGGRGGR